MPIYNVNFKTTISETIQIEANNYDEACNSISDIAPNHYLSDDSNAKIDHEAEVVLASEDK